MTTNRRKLGLVIIILGVLILALVIYLFINSQNRQEEPVLNEEEEIYNPSQLPSTNNDNLEPNITSSDKPRNFQEYDVSSEEELETTASDLEKIAQAFAERYGSYSNYSNYSNFSDIKIFMTSDMKLWAENYVEELKDSSQGSEEYFGVTTDAISSQVLEENNNEVVVLVSTLRRESGNRVDEGDAYNQNIEITLQKVNGSWLVDSAYWQ